MPTTTTKKAFPTVLIATVCTGVTILTVPFDKIREVFDHLYPGIMEHGILAIHTRAAKELYKQHPNLKTWIEDHPIPDTKNKETFSAYASDMENALGKTKNISGPV